MQKLISLPNFPPESVTYVIIPDVIDENKYELIDKFIEEYKDDKLNNAKNNILDVNPLFDEESKTHTRRKQMHIPLPTKYNETKFLYSYYIILSILFPLHHVYDFASIESNSNSIKQGIHTDYKIKDQIKGLQMAYATLIAIIDNNFKLYE